MAVSELSRVRGSVVPSMGDTWVDIAGRILPGLPVAEAVGRLQSWNLHVFMRAARGGAGQDDAPRGRGGGGIGHAAGRSDDAEGVCAGREARVGDRAGAGGLGRGVDTACLAAAYAQSLRSFDKDNGIAFNMLDQFPAKDHGFHLCFGRLDLADYF